MRALWIAPSSALACVQNRQRSTRAMLTRIATSRWTRADVTPGSTGSGFFVFRGSLRRERERAQRRARVAHDDGRARAAHRRDHQGAPRPVHWGHLWRDVRSPSLPFPWRRRRHRRQVMHRDERRPRPWPWPSARPKEAQQQYQRDPRHEYSSSHWVRCSSSNRERQMRSRSRCS